MPCCNVTNRAATSQQASIPYAGLLGPALPGIARQGKTPLHVDSPASYLVARMLL